VVRYCRETAGNAPVTSGELRGWKQVSDPGKKKGRKRSLPFDRLYLEESVLVGLPIELRSYHCSEQIL
jgi:hypothetical protein